MQIKSLVNYSITNIVHEAENEVDELFLRIKGIEIGKHLFVEKESYLNYQWQLISALALFLNFILQTWTETQSLVELQKLVL